MAKQGRDNEDGPASRSRYEKKIAVWVTRRTYKIAEKLASWMADQTELCLADWKALGIEGERRLAAPAHLGRWALTWLMDQEFERQLEILAEGRRIHERDLEAAVAGPTDSRWGMPENPVEDRREVEKAKPKRRRKLS